MTLKVTLLLAATLAEAGCEVIAGAETLLDGVATIPAAGAESDEPPPPHPVRVSTIDAMHANCIVLIANMVCLYLVYLPQIECVGIPAMDRNFTLTMPSIVSWNAPPSPSGCTLCFIPRHSSVTDFSKSHPPARLLADDAMRAKWLAV
ncbi:MAG TPA: hypothetical protein VIM63_20685 [Rhodoferax sp.]